MGSFGSIAADLVRLRHASNNARSGLPALYRHPRFYSIALATAVAAELVAVAEGADKPIFAVEVGIVIPLLVHNFERKPPTLPPVE